MTKTELMKKIKVLNLKDKDIRNRIVCSLIGHSRIQTVCWGYYYCARCGDQVGDSLGSIYPEAENVVIINHNCKKCKTNYKKLTWKDKLYTPNPFRKEKK